MAEAQLPCLDILESTPQILRGPHVGTLKRGRAVEAGARSLLGG